MDSFDETLQKAKCVFDSAVKKTSELVLVGKQRVSVSALEGKLAKAYIKLGKVQFKVLKNSEIEDPELSAAVSEIEHILCEIRSVLDEMERIDGKPVCPKCKNRAPKGSDFCNKCGEKFK